VPFWVLVYFKHASSALRFVGHSHCESFYSALDKNEYNHITATYFLLAERKLRAHRQEQMQKSRPEALDVSSRYVLHTESPISIAAMYDSPIRYVKSKYLCCIPSLMKSLIPMRVNFIQPAR